MQVDNANLANLTITMAQETLAVPKLNVPFGLDITLFTNVYEFIIKSTLKSYSQVVNNFQSFCLENNYCLSNLREQNVIDFI